MLWTTEPVCRAPNCLVFPVVFDAFSPLSIKSPSFALLGVIIYFRVPSSYLIKDILADLLGSYSIDSMNIFTYLFGKF